MTGILYLANFGYLGIFWLPWYFEDISKIHEEFKDVDNMFIAKRTKVIKLNFIRTIESYLDEQ